MSLIKIDVYKTSVGKCPYFDWLNDLEVIEQAMIEKRLARIRLGNFGDCLTYPGWKGMYELRLDHGPGYRVYIGKKGFSLVILLIGGDKKARKKILLKQENTGNNVM